MFSCWFDIVYKANSRQSIEKIGLPDANNWLTTSTQHKVTFYAPIDFKWRVESSANFIHVLIEQECTWKLPDDDNDRYWDSDIGTASNGTSPEVLILCNGALKCVNVYESRLPKEQNNTNNSNYCWDWVRWTKEAMVEENFRYMFRYFYHYTPQKSALNGLKFV